MVVIQFIKKMQFEQWEDEMEEFIKRFMEMENSYKGFLEEGLFGKEIDAFFLKNPNDPANMKWYAIVIFFILGMVMVGWMAVLEDFFVAIRVLTAVMVLIAVLAGTDGTLFTGMVVSTTMLQMVYTISDRFIDD